MSSSENRRDTGLASMGQVFRRLLEMHGVDAVAIARLAGVDLLAVPGPAERVDAEKLDVVLLAAVPLIEDPAFGLQAARCWHPANLGVLGHAWLSSSTLRWTWASCRSRQSFTSRRATSRASSGVTA